MNYNEHQYSQKGNIDREKPPMKMDMNTINDGPLF